MSVHKNASRFDKNLHFKILFKKCTLFCNHKLCIGLTRNLLAQVTVNVTSFPKSLFRAWIKISGIPSSSLRFTALSLISEIFVKVAAHHFVIIEGRPSPIILTFRMCNGITHLNISRTEDKICSYGKLAKIIAMSITELQRIAFYISKAF